LFANTGSIALRFPGGKRKAVSLSYDDGTEHDRRFVAMLNAHGLRGSFNLNASTLGQEYRVGRDEAVTLYEGHEVAGHGLTHADLVHLSDGAIRREVFDDKAELEDLFGCRVRGFAYPFGTSDSRVESLVSEAGYVYARGIHNTGDASLPEAGLTLSMTCHHSEALEKADDFLREESEAPQWLRVWGHSYEFDGFMTADTSKDWSYMETFCRTVGGRDDVWAATMIEVVDYLAAARALSPLSAGKGFSNRSRRSVWVAIDGEVLQIPSQRT
jgi:peptidoglycan/xylan/chitin deacetylase (PgdA/CDA1 family)